jgi:hypothetical protein
MTFNKSRKIEIIKMWINELTAYSDYNAELLKPYNGDQLDTMTIKELDMMLAFIKAAYHKGFRQGDSMHKEPIWVKKEA